MRTLIASIKRWFQGRDEAHETMHHVLNKKDLGTIKQVNGKFIYIPPEQKNK